MLIGIDTGGTFTDAVVVTSGPGEAARIGMGKALSTPGDLTAGALASLEAAAADLGRLLGEVLRTARRRDRIGRDPAPPLTEPPAGRRLSSTVVLAEGHYLCRRCGHDHGSITKPLVSLLVLARSPVDERTPWPSACPGADRFELRRLYCPACAVQVDVQVALCNAPVLETAELL